MSVSASVPFDLVRHKGPLRCIDSFLSVPLMQVEFFATKGYRVFAMNPTIGPVRLDGDFFEPALQNGKCMNLFAVLNNWPCVLPPIIHHQHAPSFSIHDSCHPSRVNCARNAVRTLHCILNPGL